MFSLFFNDPATTEIYTLSLHDALPILRVCPRPVTPSSADSVMDRERRCRWKVMANHDRVRADRKSTRLNSSHSSISYAVFCLKKKKKNNSATRKSTAISHLPLRQISAS